MPNILGPLTNPAGAKSQIVGVADGSLLEKLALALKKLGCYHALIVHGEDGLDEVSITRKTLVYEINDGNIKHYSISPRDFGMAQAEVGSLKGGTAVENAAILRDVMSGAQGPQRDAVVINAAATLLAGDRVGTLKQGVDLAIDIINSGQALAKMEQLAEFSQGIGRER